MLTLFDTPLSLNCYKVRLLLALLKVKYERRAVDLRKGEHRSPEMLALNPFGQVPVLTTGGNFMRDSNAILIWIARRFADGDWMPSNVDDEACVNAWLAAAAFELRLGPYEARLRKRFPALCVTGDTLADNTARAMDLFENRLCRRDWIALDHPTVADVAAFPALAHCGEGDVDLGPYPAIRAWLDRVRSLDGFVGLAD